MTHRSHIERKVDLYTAHAPHYDTMMEAFIGAESLHRRANWAVEAIGPGQRVLDLGCGTGHLLRMLAHRVGQDGEVIGADLCPAMLDLARERVADAEAPVKLMEVDATLRLPFESESFDCVCALALLQEVPAPRALLEEIFRIIRPGGAVRGLATTYRALIPAAEIHMAAAEEVPFYFRTQQTIATMFLQIFGPAAATRFEAESRLTDPAIWASVPHNPMGDIFDAVRSAGHDPAEIEMGVLYLTGRRVA